jgi:hypothetical protein
MHTFFAEAQWERVRRLLLPPLYSRMFIELEARRLQSRYIRQKPLPLTRLELIVRPVASVLLLLIGTVKATTIYC